MEAIWGLLPLLKLNNINKRLYTQSIPGAVGAYIGTLTVNKIECD